MKKKREVSFSLAIRFMLIIGLAMICLAIIFVGVLRHSVVSHQDKELDNSIKIITKALNESGQEELAFLDIPYYITYTVYHKDSREILATNDQLLPLLDSQGKSSTYFVKDYFTDSNLFIRYRSQNIIYENQEYIVECAFDIANDSAARMSRELPYIALFSLVPVLIIAFFISFLISRQTIQAFKKLRDDYDREREFSSNVSHELKTPISIIDGHASLIKRWGKDDREQLCQSIDAILTETKNMENIVNSLLDMSRLENGKIKVEKSKFFASNLFSGLKEEFQSLYPDTVFEIIDPDFIEIESDFQKLHQIFTVIISNSVKFAGSSCKITLEARHWGKKIRLLAIDNGPGFEEKILPHVFQRFYKGDQSHDRKISGSGLGLSIAMVLAKSLESTIKAENAPDSGAMITIEMP